MDEWEKLTHDQWVINTVSGYKIDFDEQPYQNNVPKEIPFSNELRQLVDIEVQEMLRKGAIVETKSEPNEFISTIFIVPKSNGKFRPVINLKYLNEFVHYDHFKQETFKVVLELIQEGDFLTKIDLQDAYFSIPIHEDFQKYLKFQWNGVLYKFVCLPFGLKSAPYVFTKTLKPVFAWFRQRQIRCSYYIDDSLNLNQDRMICKDNTETIMGTLERLGFVINRKKSSIVPMQRMVFFGFIIDSVEFKIYLTEEKVQKILLKAKLLLEKGIVVVRDLASFIGLIINAFYAVLEAPLYYRELERNKLQGLGADFNFDNEVILSSQSIVELEWWCQNIRAKNGKRIRPEKVHVRCRTDASLDGWGAIDLNSDTYTNGRWTSQEATYYINHLELLAIFYALQSLYKDKQGIHIEFQSDNICAVKYVMDMGGISSTSLDRLARDIWQYSLRRNIFLSASYIPGIQNTADYFSRNFSDSTEWMLKVSIFQRLCKQFFTPDIDLFASRLNKQLDVYMSWFPSPGASGCDAFTVDWGLYQPYIFPPFNLIGRVINKIVEDNVDRVLLICPYWNSQIYWPVLIEHLCDFPVRLPRHRDLLTMPHSGELHPLRKSLRMIGVTISGRCCRVREFRQKLQVLSPTLGAEVLTGSTGTLGGTGLFGIVSDKLIPFGHLKV